MIKKVSTNEQFIQRNDNKKTEKQAPSFKANPLSMVTSTLQYCNDNPMAGVSLIDLVTAIGPRTYEDAKTNGFAAAETFRRESSGLIVNCLIPGLAVWGIAGGLQKVVPAFKDFGMANSWANQDNMTMLYHRFLEAESKDAKGLTSSLLNKIEILNTPKDATKSGWVKLQGSVLNEIKPEVEAFEKVIHQNITDKKVVENATKKLNDAVLNATGGCETIKINGKIYHNNLKTLLRDTADVGKKFLHDCGGDKAKIQQFIKKSVKFVNAKSLIGLGLIIPLAASMQYINRWITKKSSGKEGAPIYKDFVNQEKKELTPSQKAKLFTNKIAAASLMVGVAMLSMMKKPSLKMLQFTKNMPSMDQCRWIATATFASRMLAAEDQNELNEATIRDIATFGGLYFFGDYVSKLTAGVINKIKGQNILLNYTKEKPDTKNILKKFGHWVKDTKVKSFDEAAQVVPNAKGLRAICEVASLGFSMLVLGSLVPWYVRHKTNKKVQEEMKRKHNSYHSWPSVNSTSNKKTFQAFGMMMGQTK